MVFYLVQTSFISPMCLTTFHTPPDIVVCFLLFSGACAEEGTTTPSGACD